MISFTGIPAYLARASLKMKGSACIQATVQTRRDVLQNIADQSSWLKAKNLLQSNGIRWYIAPNDEPPKWDKMLKNPVFSSHGMAVYDAGSKPLPAKQSSDC
jgi:hypothetical protein